MDTAAVGVAQKEDDEKGIDEQDIFDGMIFFLAAITDIEQVRIEKKLYTLP
jgi:hypothetical protein